jgi:murein DD-endopeptidase MepM/ murein hydrolase activator NlpD
MAVRSNRIGTTSAEAAFGRPGSFFGSWVMGQLEVMNRPEGIPAYQAWRRCCSGNGVAGHRRRDAFMDAVALVHTRVQAVGTSGGVLSGTHLASFQDLLASMGVAPSGQMPAAAATAPAATASLRSDAVIVLPGDCLSRICSARLKAQGRTVTQRDIQSAVQDVAKANHLVDPNKIYSGQSLDLAVLAAAESRPTAPGASTGRVPSKPWESLVQGATALSSGYGLRKDPFTGRLKKHTGLDVVAPSGAPIAAVAEGSVTFSGWKPGYGNTVIIRHQDGLESVYGHLSRSLVQVGERVDSHTSIACVGSMGRSTGAHLHFEVRRNGKAVDPTALLKGRLPQVA